MITKKDLKESLAAQRKDITKDIETAVAQIVDAVIKHTASKDELKRVKGELSEKIDTVKEEVTEIKEKIKFLPTKDQFYAKMDDLMGEIKSMREEVTVVIGYKDQIENHETRIGKLEEVLEPNPVSS